MTPAPDAAQIRAGRIAGAMYVITMATGVFGFANRSKMIVAGDPTTTIHNIVANERLFRISIVTDMVTIAGVMLIAWGLFTLLKSFSRDLAFLAVFFRLVEMAVLTAATVSLVVALAFMKGDYQTTDTTQLHTFVRLALNTYGYGYNLGFIFLGLGSSVFAYLLMKSGYVPRFLAGWGVFSSLLLPLGCCATIVFPAIPQSAQLASQVPLGIYEVSVGAWLWARGATIPGRLLQSRG